MKKFITMLLVGLMLAGGTIAVYAEEPGDTLAESLLEEGQGTRAARLGEPKLKEFIEEIHSINDLRIERNQLRAQVIEKHDQLIDLLIAAREEGNKEELKAVKTEREKLKAINAEIKTLHEQASAARKAFREALKDGASETAGAELEKLINAHNSINDKTESKIPILDNIINILS
ncbi:MAG TPA: hypothetical protein VN580_09780 [Clostridia bacterium]|nr:hypothetical protein [Clostridia bacterium]